MSKSGRAAIIFDFDLTLVDSSQGFVDCYQYTSRRLGLPEVAPADAVRMIGTPLPDAFLLLFGEACLDRREDFIREFQLRADEVMTDATVAIPGMAAAIADLRAAGYRLAIVSQKLRFRIEEVLEREGLAAAFATVIGAEDLSRLKPDPQGLLLARDRLGVGREGALYVGDTVIDAEAARRAGLPFIAVLTGVTGREAFQGTTAIAVLASVADLPAYLRQHDPP